MDLFSYDHEELARRIQTRLDRLTVNFLRSHGARIHRDELDFHGFEHIDLEVESDGHRLVVKQSNPAESGTDSSAIKVAADISTFESLFDDQPSREVPLATLTQWIAMLPERVLGEERPKSDVDPSNPFLSEIKEREKREVPNPFLAEVPKARQESNPFAPSESDQKRRAAFEWLAGDD